MNAFVFGYSKLPTVLCQNLYRMEPVIPLAEPTAFRSLWVIDRPPLKISVYLIESFASSSRLVVPVIRSGRRSTWFICVLLFSLPHLGGIELGDG